MKLIKTVATAALLLTMASSCNKEILDKAPLDQLSPQSFYNNADEVNMGLMGIYAAVNDNWYQYDFMSDNNYCHHAWQGSLEFSKWQQNSSSWRTSIKWHTAYSTIGRVNSFLANTASAPIDAALKTRMQAEARFLRGMMYADLAFFYGDVPLVLAPQNLAEAKVTRTDKAKVLAAVHDDFDFAAANLPAAYSGTNVGRATKGAALAFKARAYLYAEQWALAAATAKQVIDLNAYSLYANYGTLFTEAAENNSEVIFDIHYIKNTRPQPWPSTALSFAEWPTPGVTADIIDSYYMKNGQPITSAAAGYNDQQPFASRDPRLEFTFVVPGAMLGTTRFIPASDGQITGARPRKYADEFNTDRGNCAINYILMRYADVLLMRAEALIEQGTTSAEVYTLINAVRQRPSVAMPTVNAVEGSGLSQSQLRDVLRHERRVEFAMESTRYSDMRRWRLTSAVKDVYGYDISKLVDPTVPSKWVFARLRLDTRTFDTNKGWLWPIPLDDMQNNSNLTQNPGY